MFDIITHSFLIPAHGWSPNILLPRNSDPWSSFFVPYRLALWIPNFTAINKGFSSYILESRLCRTYLPISYILNSLANSSFFPYLLNFRRFTDKETLEDSRNCQTLLVPPAELSSLYPSACRSLGAYVTRGGQILLGCQAKPDLHCRRIPKPGRNNELCHSSRDAGISQGTCV